MMDEKVEAVGLIRSTPRLIYVRTSVHTFVCPQKVSSISMKFGV